MGKFSWQSLIFELEAVILSDHLYTDGRMDGFTDIEVNSNSFAVQRKLIMLLTRISFSEKKKTWLISVLSHVFLLMLHKKFY